MNRQTEILKYLGSDRFWTCAGGGGRALCPQEQQEGNTRHKGKAALDWWPVRITWGVACHLGDTGEYPNLLFTVPHRSFLWPHGSLSESQCSFRHVVCSSSSFAWHTVASLTHLRCAHVFLSPVLLPPSGRRRGQCCLVVVAMRKWELCGVWGRKKRGTRK